MNKLDSYLVHTDTTMRKNNKRRRLATEQDVEAALQLIQLKDYKSDQHLPCKIQAPDRNHDDEFAKIVLESKEFLQARDRNHDEDDDKSVCNSGDEITGKRKSDGGASCASSSITFDQDDSSDEEVNQAVGSVKKVKKKMKKFRSVADIYDVTKPL